MLTERHHHGRTKLSQDRICIKFGPERPGPCAHCGDAIDTNGAAGYYIEGGGPICDSCALYYAPNLYDLATIANAAVLMAETVVELRQRANAKPCACGAAGAR